MYLPLSRKYRPQIFDEIIGQEHITTTLKNAISMDKLAHAYIFSGPRGIGKTSTARVFAKGLNCEKGPTEKPCNKCTSCGEISKGISLDVFEIDGASNRGIDEIRNLKEAIKLKPIYGRYKIYIIDEVHMLTAEAFNALLKTLEEPPLHVKFIFATTKIYKVLPTVVSRCQRFDFRMISTSVIIEKLKEIIKAESLDVQDDAIFLIAKNAEGSLRDAEMILDQLVSFTKGKVAGKDISKMFGILEQEILINISEAILNNEGNLILNYLDSLINSGKDAMFIATALIEHFRNLLVISSCKDSSRHVILGDDERRKLEDLSHKFSIEELFYIVYTLSNALDLIGKTSLGKIPLEIALLKLSRKEKLIPINEIMKSISQLENSIKAEESSPDIDRQKTRIYKQEIKHDRPEPSNYIPEAVEQKSTPALSSGPDQDMVFQRLKGVWPEIIRGVKNKKMSAGSYLEEGLLLDLKDKKIIVGFSKLNAFHKDALDTKQNKDIITNAIKQILEIDLKIDFAFSEEKSTEEGLIPQDLNGEATSAPHSKKVEPIIRSAVDIFGGKIVKEDYPQKSEKR